MGPSTIKTEAYSRYRTGERDYSVPGTRAIPYKCDDPGLTLRFEKPCESLTRHAIECTLSGVQKRPTEFASSFHAPLDYSTATLLQIRLVTISGVGIRKFLTSEGLIS
ncbi:hypothetical protein PIIN_11515 [Serendipita indica DSM 11827]|uniref:Uncharacterized protein n=1 Tax=Serendipita indica (strain DSM 11827) TaxID=1109443 RepID=G4U1U5_SERID|nr:hypothetical protein PIIN_11515 [Serendipita indica DSM 11827]